MPSPHVFTAIPAAVLKVVNRQWLYPFLVWLDTALAAIIGQSWPSVRVITAAALPANTWSLAAQTKTMNAAGVLTVDGVALVLGDRFWDKDDGTGLRRGLFEVTREGTMSVAAIVTRAEDADESGDFVDGKSFNVQEGTQAGTVWAFTNNAPFVLNTDTPVVARQTNVMLTDATQTVTAAKRFATLMLQVWNAAQTFVTKFTTSATADRTVNWPDASGDAVLDTATQTLTNKTLTDIAGNATFVKGSNHALGVDDSTVVGETGGKLSIAAAVGGPADAGTPGGAGGDLELLGSDGGAGSAAQSSGNGSSVIIDAGATGADGGGGQGTNGHIEIGGANATDIRLKQDTTMAAGKVFGFGAFQALSGAGAANVTTRTTRCTTAGVGDAVTLANGTRDGQRKSIVMGVQTNPGDTTVITPASFQDGTTITLSQARDGVELEWSVSLGKWFAVAVNGIAVVA